MKFLTFKWHGNELVRSWYSYSALKRFRWHHGGLGPFNYYSKMIEIRVIETAHLKWIRLVSHREKMKRHKHLLDFCVLFCYFLLFPFFWVNFIYCLCHPPPLPPPINHSPMNLFFIEQNTWQISLRLKPKESKMKRIICGLKVTTFQRATAQRGILLSTTLKMEKQKL